MLERVVLSDEMRKNKATGKLMTRQEKIDYVMKWKIKNKHILKEGGLLVPKSGHAAHLTTPLKFMWDLLFNICSTDGGAPSSEGISSRCLSYEFWEVHTVLMLWHHC